VREEEGRCRVRADDADGSSRTLGCIQSLVPIA
jgi:hypothetical protein